MPASIVDVQIHGNANPISFTLDGPTSGNLLVVGFASRGGDDTPTSDQAGWTLIHNEPNERLDTTYRAGVCIMAKISDGTETGALTFDFGGTDKCWGIMEEWQPASGTSFDALGSEEVAGDGSVTTQDLESIASGNTTSVSSTENLLIAALYGKWRGNNTFTSGSYASLGLAQDTQDSITSWDYDSGGSAMGISMGSLTDAATGTKATTGTLNGDTDATRTIGIALAVFSQSAAGAEQEPSLVGGKLTNNSLLLRHLAH